MCVSLPSDSICCVLCRNKSDHNGVGEYVDFVMPVGSQCLVVEITRTSIVCVCVCVCLSVVQALLILFIGFLVSGWISLFGLLYWGECLSTWTLCRSCVEEATSVVASTLPQTCRGKQWS